MVKKMGIENATNFNDRRKYDTAASHDTKLKGLSKDGKVSALMDYWPSTKALDMKVCNKSLWAEKVKNFAELETLMAYAHDSMLLCYDDTETLDRCVAMYTYWLRLLKKENYEYNQTTPSNFPEWFFNHTKATFPIILGDLALMFDSHPQKLPKEVPKSEDLLTQILDTISVIGDIPKDATESVDSENLRKNIKSNQIRKKSLWIWDHILKMLLYIVDQSFYTDIDTDNVPKISQQAIKLLINAFIIASHESFPSPTLWSEFELLCQGIIHIDTVCKEWKSVCMTLTVQQLKMMYGKNSGHVARNTSSFHTQERLQSVIAMMEPENLVQCWARFIVLLGNPARLMELPASLAVRIDSRVPRRQGDAPKKREYDSRKAKEKYHKVCLLMVQGIRCLVEAMLSVGLPSHSEYDGARAESPDKVSASHTHFTRKSDYDSSDLSVSAPSNINATNIHRRQDTPLDCKIIPIGNSVLRLFGEWLFDCTYNLRKMTYIDPFYRASAEALGTLCFIFSHNRYDDPFEKDYMVRFVIRLTEGLRAGMKQLENDGFKVDCKKNDVLIKILQESGSLFKVDLPGINALLLSYFEMIERVLNQRIDRQDRPRDQLRGHAIEILLSIICLPLRYPSTPLQHYLERDSGSKWPCGMQQMEHLWKGCMDVLLKALDNAIDEEGIMNKSQIMKGLYILLLDKRYDKSGLGTEDYVYQTTSPTTKYNRDSVDGDCPLEGKTNSMQSIEQLQDDNPLYNLWLKMIDLICKILEKASDKTQEIKFWYVPFGILCGLANTFPYSKNLEVGYKTTIRKLCDYIESLSLRPQPQQRTELHTMLAAAYNCLTMWCLHYHDLFNDAKQLFRCLQVIELGITSKGSYDHLTKTSIRKEDKTNKQISQRVGDKAQFLLKQLNHHHPINEHVAYQNTQFSERTLLQYWQDEDLEHQNDLCYLVLEKYTIVCFINPPVGAGVQDTPILYQVVRDPDISLSLHWYKYDKRPLTDHSPPYQKVPRPVVVEKGDQRTTDQAPIYFDLNWPSVLSEKYDIDEDTRSMTDIQNELKSSEACSRLAEVNLDKIINETITRSTNLIEPPAPPDLQIPECVKNINSSRLFLAHCGILTGKLFDDSNGKTPSVTLLNNCPELQRKLKELDSIPTRDCHTITVLYMRSGQNNIEEILSNKHTLKSGGFHNFLISLGDMVDISKHKGWTGLQPFQTWAKGNQDTPAPIFPYYSDSFNEMIFLVPNMIPRQEDLESPGSSPDSDTLDMMLFDQEFRQADTEYKPNRSYYQQQLLDSILWEVQTGEKTDLSKIVVVWAESFDDTLRFPICMLPRVLGNQKDSRHTCVVIFVHPLKSGLFKTNVVSLQPRLKFDTSGLLDDEKKVVSEHILPIVVRETCLAIRTSSLLEQQPKFRPKSRRQNQIDNIVRDHHSSDTPNSYFNCFFNVQ